MIMYEYADKAVRNINGMLINQFRKLRGKVLNKDELNVIQETKILYQYIYNTVKEQFTKIAINAYDLGYGLIEYETDMQYPKKTEINVNWVTLVLQGYNPIVKYVFEHEIERKASRFAEAIIASRYNTLEFDKAMKLLSNQIAQFAIYIVDMAIIQAYTDCGILKVRWITIEDEKTCDVCAVRDGNIYHIDKVPTKPHIGCRCFLMPIGVNQDDNKGKNE